MVGYAPEGRGVDAVGDADAAGTGDADGATVADGVIGTVVGVVVGAAVGVTFMLPVVQPETASTASTKINIEIIVVTFDRFVYNHLL